MDTSKIEEFVDEQARLYMQNCVLQEWVYLNCSFKQQTVLLCALRGCDTATKEDASKALTRKIRSVVLQDADPKRPAFMKEDKARLRTFLADLDHYPLHWLMHSLHACEIIGYKCENNSKRNSFHELYLEFVEALHLQPESQTQMDLRLTDETKKPVIARSVRGYDG